jgi:hypothetical protein
MTPAESFELELAARFARRGQLLFWPKTQAALIAAGASVDEQTMPLEIWRVACQARAEATGRRPRRRRRRPVPGPSRPSASTPAAPPPPPSPWWRRVWRRLQARREP